MTTRISGNYAYVLTDSTWFIACDISEPANVTEAGYAITSCNAYSGAVSGNFLYLPQECLGICSIYYLGIPPPRLAVSRTPGNEVLLSWPTPAGAFAVQQSSLVSGASWVTLTNVPVTVASNNQVSLTLPTNSVFYRLISK